MSTINEDPLAFDPLNEDEIKSILGTTQLTSPERSNDLAYVLDILVPQTASQPSSGFYISP